MGTRLGIYLYVSSSIEENHRDIKYNFCLYFINPVLYNTDTRQRQPPAP